MDLTEQLQADGWVLSPEGYTTITDDGKLTNKQQIVQKVLNTDVRDLGGCAFPAELSKGKCETVSGNIVVQIQKIRNISAPKANEESQAAPRMLKMLLTDGTQLVPAIEMDTLSKISLNTPPGTKIKLKGEIIVSCGLLQLNSDQVEVLGGIVSNLVDKWTVNRNLAKYTRGRYGIEGGPPQWIPFGEKMAPTNLSDKNFKSLDDGSKENKGENDEFEAQRRDAIAEAGKAGCTKKVFGGGTKPLLDKNVQAIIEKGFSIDQAEAALRQNRNNVDRAIKSLTKRTGRGNDDKGDKEKESGGGGRGRRKGEDESGPKPSGRVCLFQYLEEKLPFLPEKEKPPKEQEKKEWEYSHFNSRSGDGSFSGGNRQPRNDRFRGGGSSSRGGGNSGHNSHNRDFTNTDRKPREDHKDGRNPRWQNPNHNQKPPRFQNQQNKRIEPQTSDHFDHFISRSSDNGNSRSRNNADGYFASKSNNSSSPREHSNNAQQFNGYRNNYKPDNIGQFNSGPSSGEHRNQSSSFFKPAGMPDIPEFPYKDSSSFAPIVSQSPSNSCMPDIPAFPYKDNSSFKPMPATNSHNGNQVNNRNSSAPPMKEEKYRWNKGDKCIAKYWEDNMYYDAEVTGVSKKTCVVRFLDYGNFEEVLQDDCIPITEDLLPNVQSSHSSDDHNSNYNSNRRSNNHFSGVLEFRRGGNRPYVKLEGMGPRKNHRQSQPVYMPPPSRNS